MNRTDTHQRLEEFMRRGLPHRAWDFARLFIEGEGHHPSLRRVLKYGFLRKYLVPRLPGSFWDEQRVREARRLGVTRADSPLRVGEVAFPVIFSTPDLDCFVVASVRHLDATEDALPSEARVDEDTREAMRGALDAARRLTGHQGCFRVSLDTVFPEKIRGSSCGLAVTLAALSCIEERELDDGIAATGEVTRELVIKPVRDLARKSALRREARPLARLLCPVEEVGEEGLVPVSRLEDARKAAWKPSPEAQHRAMEELKRTRARNPDHLTLPFRGIAKVLRGSNPPTLELLGFAVAPSLQDERSEQAELEKQLRGQVLNPDLSREEHTRIQLRLLRMEQRRWGSQRGVHPGERPFPFARVLQHKRFTIIGDPGAGKSLLTRLVFLACSPGDVGEQARRLLLGHDGFNRHSVEAVELLQGMLPVRLGLAGFGRALSAEPTLSLETFCRRELRTEGARHAVLDGLRELLETGRLFLLCDGLDEVAEEHRERVVDAIQTLVHAYPHTRMLVTSRPHGYYPKVHDFHPTRLAPLEPWQRRLLVARLHRLVETRAHPGPDGVIRARHRTNALLRAIEQRAEWEQLSANPLLLTITALADPNAEGAPEHQVVVFEGLIQTILGEWRAALRRSEAEADDLLTVWSAVAFKLVKKEERDGVEHEKLRRMLSEALRSISPPPSINARLALHLALEAGLVRENGRTVSFWHSTFAEFLAARFLAREGMARRILEEKLTPPALHFAAALLDHVFGANDECHELARQLLARDEQGSGPVLRPGLRTVSDWLVDGVRLDPETRTQLWQAWLEVLEKSPPSLLWGDFGRFAERVPLKPVEASIVTRLIRVDSRRAAELQEGMARLVAAAEGLEPDVRSVCEQWLQEPAHSSLGLRGAFSLARASTGTWSDEVITLLGRFRTTRAMGLHDMRDLVRDSDPSTRARLWELVRERLPSDEARDPSQTNSATEAQREETERQERRRSAASLLAVAGEWDETLARWMKELLQGSLGSSHDDEFQSTVRFCASDSAVREALLEWMLDPSTLGERARKIVGDVAPLYEDMPQRILDGLTRAEPKVREQLESMLVMMGEELYTLPELLRRCLERESNVESRMSAARILGRLSPEDGCLHEALRRGMRERDAAERARWARLALGLEQGLSAAAIETLLACARSPDAAVRQRVYDGHPAGLLWHIGAEYLQEWMDCAADKAVPAAARFDALEAVAHTPGVQSRVVPLLRELVQSEDRAVRSAAAQKLMWHDALDERAVIVLVEADVRGERDSGWGLRGISNDPPLAILAVKTFLRELREGRLSIPPQDPPLSIGGWSSWVCTLLKDDLSCTQEFLSALELPGLAGDIAERVLDGLIKHEAVRAAVRERLKTAMPGMNVLGRYRLLTLSLSGGAPSEGVSYAHLMDPSQFTSAQLDWLARQLKQAREPHTAARLWRHVLDAESPDLVLEAIEGLVQCLPAEAPAWIRPAVARLFGAPDPVHRLEAARFALHDALLEEDARKVLLACLELREETPARRGRYSLFGVLRRRAPLLDDAENDDDLNELLRQHPPRVDFRAMHALCARWREPGVRRLASWLEDSDFERYACAVKILARNSAYREQVVATLEGRLRSGSVEELVRVIELAEEQDLCSEDMVELLLSRYVMDPTDEQLQWCVGTGLYQRPERWAAIRRQAPENHVLFLQWLERQGHPVLDRVAFAVDFVLAHAGTHQARHVMRLLGHWCKPPEAGADAQSNEWPTSDVRAWTRQALLSRSIPADLFVLLAFDELAGLAEAPSESRIDNLLRALAIGIDLDAEHGSQQLYLQALAARGLLTLGNRDERIPLVLERTVQMLAEVFDFKLFEFAGVLMTLGPASHALRSILLKVVPSIWLVPFESLLSLFTWAEVPVEQRIEVLIARLGRDGSANEALPIFELLETLGCPFERRTALLLEFVARHEEQLLASVLITLSARPELSLKQQAKLLLGSLSRGRHLDLDKVLEQWMERFASKAVLDDSLRLSYVHSDYLSSRQLVLARLSRVDDPVMMNEVLVELATPRTVELATLHRRACTGPPLAPEEWRALLALLRVEAHDKPANRLAKEWLMLEVWRALEPARLEAWVHS